MKNLALFGQNLLKPLDYVNDRLTSYRLVLYSLIAFLSWGIIGGLTNRIGFSWQEIIVSVAFLLAVCAGTNRLLAKVLNIPVNKESDLISSLILALILSPPKRTSDFVAVAAAGVVAMASKYLIVLSKSHIFNPAAAGAFISGVIFHYYASWWVGTAFMTPLVAVCGLLILRKMRRFWMAFIFWLIYALYFALTTHGGTITAHFLWLDFTSTQLLFFGVIMLTEPLTSPTMLRPSLIYAALVALLYSVPRLGLTPEEALLIGNLVTLGLNRNRRYELRFVNKIKEADNIYSYVFSKPAGFKFRAGQYMEWTLAENKTDSRGNRRYLTISSAPDEKHLMFTIKMVENASRFKRRLETMMAGDKILAGHLAGNFTLPKQPKKLALMAGGVGITPFHSIIKQLVEQNQTCDAALIYQVTSDGEIAFKNLFSRAEDLGIKAHYLSGQQMDKSHLAKWLPDWRERTYYISGPYGYVQSVKRTLLEAGVGLGQIVTDYFPGYG